MNAFPTHRALSQEHRTLALLAHRPRYARDLAAQIGIDVRAVAPLVSRLRKHGYKIATQTGEAWNPRYELLAGRNSLGPVLTCPSCAASIEIGSDDQHEPSCPFGLPKHQL